MSENKSLSTKKRIQSITLGFVLTFVVTFLIYMLNWYNSLKITIDNDILYNLDLLGFLYFVIGIITLGTLGFSTAQSETLGGTRIISVMPNILERENSPDKDILVTSWSGLGIVMGGLFHFVIWILVKI